MPLGMEVGFGRGHIVLDGDTAPPPKKKRDTAPNFWPISIMAKRGWMDQDVTWYGGKPRLQKGHSPQFSARLLWPHGCVDQDITWYGGLGDIVLDGYPAPLS